jgi:hypothetical protein
LAFPLVEPERGTDDLDPHINVIFVLDKAPSFAGEFVRPRSIG